MKAYPSIFNDVLSPVTPGPSSSNTCGPFRIGKLLRQLLGGTPVRMKIEMAEKGGYSQTFYGMHSDKAFIGGILGKDLHSYQFNRAYDDAQKEGMTVEVEFNDSVFLNIGQHTRRRLKRRPGIFHRKDFIDRICNAVPIHTRVLFHFIDQRLIEGSGGWAAGYALIVCFNNQVITLAVNGNSRAVNSIYKDFAAAQGGRRNAQSAPGIFNGYDTEFCWN